MIGPDHRAKRLAIGPLVLLLLGSSATLADEPGDVLAAIAAGDAGILARYRYEFVDQDSFDDNANASTLLLRLNYETAGFMGWSAFAEFDYIGELLVNDFNSGAGTSSARRDRYPVVADPKGPDLNQLFLAYALGDRWTFRFGRRVLNLDDWRFVGSVVWRQNEQAYDGVELVYKGLARTDIFYSYVNRVKRIFGNTVPAGSHRQDTHLLNVRAAVTDDWSLIGFAYLIDNQDEPSFSTQTYGLRAEGSTALAVGTLDVVAVYAFQTSAYNAPAEFDADFVQLLALWNRDAWSFGAGFELLGSDNGQGFRTPLSTLHKFNGWADLFLTTPGDGLKDTYLRIDHRQSAWTWSLRLHDFRADAGSGSWGREIDLSADRKLGDRVNLLAKAALFDTSSAAYDDTVKFWLMLTFDVL